MNAGRRGIQYATDGVLGGLVLAFAQTIMASVSGRSALYPFDAAASTLLGKSAITAPNAASLLLGLLVHITLSALLGLVYHHRRGKEALSFLFTSSGRLRPAVSGILFGLLIWGFTMAIARIAYPWLNDVPALYAWWTYAFFFGWPLGMLAARTERCQPVELKIVYSAASERPQQPPRPGGSNPRPPSASPSGSSSFSSAPNCQPKANPSSPAASGQPRRPPSGASARRRLMGRGDKKPILRLLVNSSHDPPGHDRPR